MLTESKLFIKGMVCNRCIQVIRTELDGLGMKIGKVILGEVTVINSDKLPAQQLIARSLSALGFELVEDKKDKDCPGG